MAGDPLDALFGPEEPDDVDGPGDDGADPAPPPPLRVERRRTVKRASAAGAIAGAIALGLREVFEPEDREEIVTIVGQGEPDPDAPVDLLLLKDQPERSRARVRPWLLDPTPGSARRRGAE